MTLEGPQTLERYLTARITNYPRRVDWAFLTSGSFGHEPNMAEFEE